MLFKELKQNLTKDFSGLPTRRLALVGDSATQFVAKALKAYGYEEQLNLEIFEAEYNQIDRQLLDGESELYHSQPEFIVLCPCTQALWARFAVAKPEAKASFAAQVLSDIQAWWQAVARLSTARLIHFNFLELNDGVFGHFAAKTPAAFGYQLKKINFELMNLAQQAKHVFIADMNGLAAQMGYATAVDPRLYAASKVACALDFLPLAAKAVVDIIKAAGGNIKKCLVLDLDNTVWGGVIGDDGLENIQVGELGLGHAYDQVQQWAKALKDRGIILAVCSKNNEETAKLPFQQHPDMILRLEDIALFVANWDNKADNLKLIQRTLNIGFDSMVFVDDNPFERNLVRELIPAVTVPELPEDPALYVNYLSSLNLFETASFSHEDLQRTQQYQEEIARADFQKSFTSVDDYLRGLGMSARVKAFDDFSVPRVAQLTQRSNQFNLRTVRYTEADIDRLRESERFVTLSLQLEDKFGDHGLVGVVILQALSPEEAFIDTWIMSCRVLKRGMEEFTVNAMVRQARKRGFRRLVGEYLPTPKNGLVKELYPQMGFTAKDGKWELDLSRFSEMKTFVSEK